MYRCVIAASAAFFVAAPAAAQVQRNFPQNALRGALVVDSPPQVTLNGRPARLAPGARIRGTQNMLEMSGALVGMKLLVHYTLDPEGLVKEVWILTPVEAAKKPWPTATIETQTWTFDPVAQVWSKP